MIVEMRRLLLTTIAGAALLLWMLAGSPVSAQLSTPPLPVSPAAGGPAPVDADAGNGQGDEQPDAAYVEPADLVAKAFGAPPDAKRVSRDGRLWVDTRAKRVIVDGYVAMTEGPLEMFACPAQTKEHESVVGVLARSREVHAALLAIGAQPGTPVQFVPEFVPATGQRIRIWVLWRDAAGKVQHADARHWVQYTGRDKHLEMDWVFAGSSFWTDPADGQTYYQADAGDMVCVSNFSTALLDLPVASSQETGQLQFSAYKSRIPDQLTPVRLVMMPIPLPSDHPQPRAPGVADPEAPPGEELLPPASAAPVDATPPSAAANAAAADAAAPKKAATADERAAPTAGPSP